jgi:hypothetical protein
MVHSQTSLNQSWIHPGIAGLGHLAPGVGTYRVSGQFSGKFIVKGQAFKSRFIGYHGLPTDCADTPYPKPHPCGIFLGLPNNLVID